jgi:hypothetical protein
MNEVKADLMDEWTWVDGSFNCNKIIKKKIDTITEIVNSISDGLI